MLGLIFHEYCFDLLSFYIPDDFMVGGLVLLHLQNNDSHLYELHSTNTTGFSVPPMFMKGI